MFIVKTKLRIAIAIFLPHSSNWQSHLISKFHEIRLDLNQPESPLVEFIALCTAE